MQAIRYSPEPSFVIVINPKIRLDSAAQKAIIERLFFNTLEINYEELDASIQWQLGQP